MFVERETHKIIDNLFPFITYVNYLVSTCGKIETCMTEQKDASPRTH